jgi:hypothetical protein
MAPIGTTDSNIIDVRQTFEAWFAIAVKIQLKKIALLGIGETGKLFESLNYQITEKEQYAAKGFLEFNLYGKFVDMGVGKETGRGNSGNVQTTRKRKEWHSKIFYAQVMVLRELMNKKFGEGAANQMVARIQAVHDLKYQAYSASDKARNAKNYHKQINLPEADRTWLKTKGNYTF